MITGGGEIKPPAVADVLEARWWDAARLTWWAERSFLHGAMKGSAAARAFSLVLAVVWIPGVPLLVITQVGALRRRTARYYLRPERDAVLAVVARRDGWHVQEHNSSAPGTGRGRALRQLVVRCAE